MEINTLAESQTANLKVNILLETREDGSAIASILELPQYRVEAATREQALLMLKQLLVQRMDKVEVIPMEIKLPQTEQSQRPWMKFAGVFKDDPDFDVVQQYIQEYRQQLDATENVDDPDFDVVQQYKEYRQQLDAIENVADSDTQREAS